jgi:hypothetical protein
MANANAPQFTQAIANTMADAFLLAMDAGTAAIINIYAADMPTEADTAIGAQVLLATLTCSGTSAVVSDGNPGGKLTFNAITDDSSADATDTADFARIFTQAAGTTIMDCEVGTAGADINFNTVAFTSGSAISITALDITIPES